MPADSLLRRTTALRAAAERTLAHGAAQLGHIDAARAQAAAHGGQTGRPASAGLGAGGNGGAAAGTAAAVAAAGTAAAGGRRPPRFVVKSAELRAAEAAAHDRLARLGLLGAGPSSGATNAAAREYFSGTLDRAASRGAAASSDGAAAGPSSADASSSTDALSGGGAGGGTLQTTGYAQANGPGGGRHGGSGHSMLTSHGLAAARRRNEIPAHLLRELPTLASSGASSGGGGGGGGAGGRAGGGGSGGGGSGAGWSGGVDGAALAAQLSEAAFERIRAAFPPASLERRMFHELSGASSVPESDEHRRRRAADSFGRGVSLTATSAEPCCICLDTMCKGEVGLTLRCGHGFHEHCIHEWLGRKPFCPLCKTPPV